MVTAPVLSIADHALWVAGRGGHVSLGTTVSTTDPNDSVSLNIKGLPRYETITTGDGTTFRGSNITLSAAQVASGLTLTSHYRGSQHPVANLTLTATAKDPVTGAVASSATQTIKVTDPLPSTGTGSTAHHGHGLHHHLGSGRSTLAATVPQTTSSANYETAKGSQANHSFALLNQYLAGGSGRVDGGQIAEAVSNGAAWTQNAFLTKPHH